jgi:DNA polymerase-3 subunit epsilon
MVGPNPRRRATTGADEDLAAIGRALNTLADRNAEQAIGRQALELVGADGIFEPRGARSEVDASPGVELATLSFAVVDLETTGLNPDSGDRVVSMAAVRVRAGRVDRADYFDTLVDPERPIPAAATRIHGVDDAMVRGAPRLAVAVRHLTEYIGESVLVGHVIAFDLAFLEPALRQSGLASPRHHGVLDTLLLGHALFPAARVATMEDLADLLGVEVVGRHSALGDAVTTAETFARLLLVLEQRGVHRLSDALALQTPSALRRALAAILNAP